MLIARVPSDCECYNDPTVMQAPECAKLTRYPAVDIHVCHPAQLMQSSNDFKPVDWEEHDASTHAREPERAGIEVTTLLPGATPLFSCQRAEHLFCLLLVDSLHDGRSSLDQTQRGLNGLAHNVTET
jgi:hypothetical protein